MIKYTTPAISLTVEGNDLSHADVYVTLSQCPVEITKTGADLIVTTTEDNNASDSKVVAENVIDSNIVFTLSQEESAMFKSGPVSIQVNWITDEGIRSATDTASIHVGGNLLDEKIDYNGVGTSEFIKAAVTLDAGIKESETYYFSFFDYDLGGIVGFYIDGTIYTDPLEVVVQQGEDITKYPYFLKGYSVFVSTSDSEQQYKVTGDAEAKTIDIDGVSWNVVLVSGNCTITAIEIA